MKKKKQIKIWVLRYLVSTSKTDIAKCFGKAPGARLDTFVLMERHACLNQS